MAGKLAVIIIPVYKEQLDENEVLSLNRCLSIMKRHPIIFICSSTLNTVNYENACSGRVVFKRVDFDKEYFENIVGYNRLMLSTMFYKTFFQYKFMLIYQLDAFVFKDELEYWCSQGYDYIGAPHLPHENAANQMRFLKNYKFFIGFLNKWVGTNHRISNVGNGGFSLRKIQKCYWLLKVLKRKVVEWEYNEDGFFKYWGNIFYPVFKLPPDDVALRFSIELLPQQSLEKLNGELPFGCHAFEKYDPNTWQQYL